MADYGARTGGSLRDALNQMYPLTNLGGISTGFPPQAGPPPRVGTTAMPVRPQAGPPVIPPVPPVPAPTGALPPIPGAPPDVQGDSTQATLLAAQQGDPRAMALLPLLQRSGLGGGQPGMMGQGPPNYAAQLGLTR